jgi:hypothetical protein
MLAYLNAGMFEDRRLRLEIRLFPSCMLSEPEAGLEALPSDP